MQHARLFDNYFVVSCVRNHAICMHNMFNLTREKNKKKSEKKKKDKTQVVCSLYQSYVLTESLSDISYWMYHDFVSLQ